MAVANAPTYQDTATVIILWGFTLVGSSLAHTYHTKVVMSGRDKHSSLLQCCNINGLIVIIIWGFTLVDSSLAHTYHTKVVVNVSDKHSSLLRCCNIYGLKVLKYRHHRRKRLFFSIVAFLNKFSIFQLEILNEKRLKRTRGQSCKTFLA